MEISSPPLQRIVNDRRIGCEPFLQELNFLLVYQAIRTKTAGRPNKLIDLALAKTFAMERRSKKTEGRSTTPCPLMEDRQQPSYANR